MYDGFNPWRLFCFMIDVSIHMRCVQICNFSLIFQIYLKLNAQIQDDVNEEKLADKVNRKDCEDMQDALEDMLKEKRPADVFKAVQTFSTFVLRFCGGEEGAGAPEESEAESKEEEEINDWTVQG